MTPELYALIGAIVGGSATLGVTWLKHWLEQRTANRLEYKQRKALRWMLDNPRYRARSTEALASAIGETPERTKQLLILEGALPFNHGKVWSLKLPDEYNTGDEA